MELELGLKIIKTKDSLTTTDLHIAKNGSGPIFISRETEDMFTLTAHLKGYKRERIKIDISKDRSRITISGEKAVQEMMMKKWVMQKKEVEVKGFKKVFRIPDGVIHDNIKAKYNEKETVLSISMPKSTPGIQGTEIEEIKEETSQGESSRNVEASVVSASVVPRTNESEFTQPEITKGGNVVEETPFKMPEIAEINDPVVSPEAEVEDPVREDTEPMEVRSEENQQEQPPALPDKAKEEETVEAENETQKQEAEQQREVQEPIDQAESENLHSEEKIQNKVPTEEEQTKTEEHEEIKESEEQSPEHKSSDSETLQNPKTEELREENHLIDAKAEHEELQREDEIQEEPEIGDENEEPDSSDSSDDGDAKAVEENSNRNKEGTHWYWRPRVIASSALIGFLIVLVVQLMKKSNKSKKY